ncbi:MAG: DUF2254 domain-containing protein [Candidatus Marinimicrobia bacterium]|nr:DUF2254 domain-containing protein [Candidatus Neomarinimicrobiota bacterium]
MNKFKELWSNLRSNFWFMPSLIVVVSIGLAVVLIQADSTRSDRWLNQWPQLFGASAEGARGMMSTIAGSMMTVVGVSFSMILVVLALASGQYTSRILRNFMRSSATKIVLGIFAGIFTYCLIVLRTIRSADEGAFVPTLAVFFGFVMAVVGVGTLMFFIHHIASSIQASSIIASIAKETNETINLLFPEKLGHGPDEDDDEQTPPPLAKRNWCVIQSKESGYIQNVNNDELLRVARDWKTIVRMERGIGEFVVQNTPLVSLAMEDQPDQEKIAALQAAFSISRFRSVEQDPAFGIRQIVDVGLKALSPGINDTTTAVTCVDYLTAILAPMATRQIPSLHRYEKGELRVIAKGVSFESLLSESFDQIRNNASGNVAIILRMLDSFQTLAGLTVSPHRRRALREQVQLIAELAERTVESTYDYDRINTRLAEVKEILETDPVLCEG